ncbi:MAG: O-antigen ligase family protein [bacterium]
MLSFGIILVAGAVLLLAAILWSRELLMALPFVVTLNGIPLPIGGSQVRVDQLIACVLVVPLVASVLVGKRRLRMDAISWWLIALFSMNLLASALNSPTRAYSFAQCANLASAWIIYVLVVNFLDTREELERFFERCLWGALIASCIGVGAFLLSIVGLGIGGAEVSASAAQLLTRPYGAYGTMVEPNIFGSFMGSMLVLAVVLLAVSPRVASSSLSLRLLRWTTALCAVGLVLSFTRTAWLGSMIALVCAALFSRRSLGVRATRILAAPLIGVVIVVVLLFLPGIGGTFLRFKLGNLVNIESPTAVLRLMTYALALEQTLRHPIIGLGTFSFAPLLAEGNDFARFEGWRGLWIGNYLLLALHDTGVIGLALWLGMIWTIISRGVRAMRDASEEQPVLAARTLGLIAAIVCLLVAYLATTGFSLGYPWMLIGLLGAHVRLARTRDAIPDSMTVEPLTSPSPAGAT